MFGGGGMGGMGGGGMGGRVGGGAGGAGPMAGMHGALMRSTDLTDEVIFGKIYDHKVVTRLMVYLKDHKARVALAFFAMLISTLTSLFMPLLLSDAINVVTGNANKIDTIAKHLLQLFNVQGTSNIILALFLIFIANGLLNWGSQYLQIYTMSNIGRYSLCVFRCLTIYRNYLLVSTTVMRWDVLCHASKTMLLRSKRFSATGFLRYLPIF
jgi:hypothetical protein